MSASVADDGGGGDPLSGATKEKGGTGGIELQTTNTPKIRKGRDVAAPPTSAAATPASNIGKAKRKVPTSAARSAKTSREPSPTRSFVSPFTGPKTPQQAQGQQQTSVNPSVPHTTTTTTPTSTSANTTTTSDPPPSRPPSLHNTPHWPNNPRLTIPRTPPPEATQQRKTDDQSAPQTAILRREGSEQLPESDSHGNLTSGMRTPRSNSTTALETVVESSLPATPSIESTRTLEDSVAALIQRQPKTPTVMPSRIPEETDTDSASTITRKGTRRDSVSSSIAPNSTAESESEGYRSGDRTPTYKVPPPIKTFGRRPTVTHRESSSKVMTVETETVSSVPQVGLGAVGPPGGASIRSKKSNDTIRAPRREKRRATKRSTPAGPSNPSSKADIFAAKIAEAVDEANSSDSAETFVYESNPPDSSHVSHQRPASRFHSRTPSATSLGPDPRGQRLPLLNTDGASTAGRKGMKFVNHSLNKETSFGGDGMPSDAMAGPERGIAGSSRDQNGRGDRGGARHHNGTHGSALPSDGPFNRASPHTKSNRTAANSIMSSRTSMNAVPSSPKNSLFKNGTSLSGVGKRSPRPRAYEADIENGDDEQTPLMMAGRSKPRRRLNGSLRQMEYTARRRGCIRTYAGCIVAVFAIFAILSGVTGFLVSTTNALQGIKVLNVTDVLVSKQEIMLDLVVQAMNPNAIAVTIGSMDVNLFAKSSHVREGGEGGDGDDDDNHNGDWWEIGKLDNVDEGTDPPGDIPESDKETMLLGRIFVFDSFLTFEGSPIRRLPSISVGELRLAKPGNKTEEGGSARWERVLLHPFELIVRGVLKYQLPLSGRVRTAPISGSVMINPGLGNIVVHDKTKNEDD